jgi:streptogramin lyase
VVTCGPDGRWAGATSCGVGAQCRSDACNPLTVVGGAVTATAGLPLMGTVANVVTPWPVTALAVTIDWGDGTGTSLGGLLGAAPGSWAVSPAGGHVYAATGPYTMTVTAIADGSVLAVASDAGIAAMDGAVSGLPDATAVGDGAPMDAGEAGDASATTLTASATMPVTVRPPPTFAAYDLPEPSRAGVFGIVAGADGNLWFTEQLQPRIGRITTDGGITEFPTPSQGRTQGVTLGADGNVWFTEPYLATIGRIATDGQVAEYPLPTSPEAAAVYMPWIATGPDGNLWFSEDLGSQSGQIGRTTAGASFTGFSNASPVISPYAIAAGGDGNMWFTDQDNLQIGRVTMQGQITVLPLPSSFGVPQAIAQGPDGAMWFPEASSIARVSPDGALTVFDLGGDKGPTGIATGPDGNLWFTENSGVIGRMTPMGAWTEFVLPRDAAGDNPALYEICAGPDGNLWFTDLGDNRIRSITP